MPSRRVGVPEGGGVLAVSAFSLYGRSPARSVRNGTCPACRPAVRLLDTDPSVEAGDRNGTAPRGRL